MKSDFSKKRARGAINKNNYSGEGIIKISREKYEEHKKKARNLVIAAVIGSAVLSGAATTGLMYTFNDQVTEYKVEKEYNELMVEAMDNNLTDELMDQIKKCGNISYDSYYRYAFPQHCDDPNCVICNENELIREAVENKLSKDNPEAQEIINNYHEGEENGISK